MLRGRKRLASCQCEYNSDEVIARHEQAQTACQNLA